MFGCMCWFFVFVLLTVTKWQLCAMQVLSSSSSQGEKIQLLSFGTWHWRGRRWDTFIEGCSDEHVCSTFNNYSWLCRITYLVTWNLDLSSQVDGYTPCKKSQLLNKLVNIIFKPWTCNLWYQRTTDYRTITEVFTSLMLLASPVQHKQILKYVAE
jgi:hypothetical protein